LGEPGFSKIDESKNLSRKKMKGRIAITFGDRVENNVGMEILGKSAESGFTCSELKKLAKKYNGEFHDLRKVIRFQFSEDSEEEDEGEVDIPDHPELPEAGIVIFRGLLKELVDIKKLRKEQLELEYDKKAYMRGRVVNKLARWNLCFTEKEQEPDYEEGQGRTYSFKSLKYLNQVRKALGEKFGKKAENLLAESNYYFDMKNCGIGFHGDTERKIVLCCSLGETTNLFFRWYFRDRRIYSPFQFEIRDGDIYLMSEEAVGNKWKKKAPCLRHAAGSQKYVKN
jgi:hypothetical protein